MKKDADRKRATAIYKPSIHYLDLLLNIYNVDCPLIAVWELRILKHLSYYSDPEWRTKLTALHAGRITLELTFEAEKKVMTKVMHYFVGFLQLNLSKYDPSFWTSKINSLNIRSSTSDVEADNKGRRRRKKERLHKNHYKNHWCASLSGGTWLGSKRWWDIIQRINIFVGWHKEWTLVFWITHWLVLRKAEEYWGVNPKRDINEYCAFTEKGPYYCFSIETLIYCSSNRSLANEWTDLSTRSTNTLGCSKFGPITQPNLPLPTVQIVKTVQPAWVSALCFLPLYLASTNEIDTQHVLELQ